MGRLLAIGALVITTSVAVNASEYNFYEQAGKKGCSSIITERGQSDCASVQSAKNRACSVSVECDVDRQTRLIDKYKEAKDRLDRGAVADADKDKLEDSINAMKDELDKNKSAARTGTSVAQGCVDARLAVQKWFMEDGIRLTEHTRDDALELRKNLLEKLSDAQKKQAAAKANRDAKPNDSSAQSDYDHATDDMRAAEKALEDFNNKYGKDIAQYADKLISHYKDEKESHEKPLSETRNRVDNCKKVDDMSY
jgi:hypothetical protein